MLEFYTFVDKNCLIPYIKTFDTKKYALDFLSNYVCGKCNKYKKNIYVVHESNDDNCNKIYMYNNDIIWISCVTNSNDYINKEKFDESINNIYKNCDNNKIDKINKVETNKVETNKVETNNIKIDKVETDTNNKNNTKTIENDIDTSKISIDNLEKKDLQILINKMKDELIGEKSKAKELSANINNINKKKEEQIKNCNNVKIKYLSNIKNDYKLFLTLEKKKKTNGDFKIPLLYTNIYEHISYLVKNKEIKCILDEIYKFDIDKMYINNELNIEDEILVFSKNYAIKSKENHLSFEHRWEKIEEDENVNNILMKDHV